MMSAAWILACLGVATAQSNEPRVIAAAPLVTNPIHVAAGIGGTIWIVERDGTTDSLSILRDENGDGTMDSAVRVLEGLIDVRGIAVVGERRVLVLEPPQLLDVEDRDGDGRAERIAPLARGLSGATGVAVSAETEGVRTILVAGDDREFIFDGAQVRVDGETPWRDARTVALDLKGVPVAAVGSLIVRGTTREPIGLAGNTDLALTRGALVVVSEDRMSLARPGVPNFRWSFGEPTPADILWSIAEDQGPINDIDRLSTVTIAVAIGASEKVPGSIIAWSPPLEPRVDESWLLRPAHSDDSVRRALDLALTSGDDSARRAVVEQALAEPENLLVVERIAAAMRLNDRRPRRLVLDQAPRGFDPNGLSSLHPTLARVIGRLSWPGRHDAAMEPEPPPSIADVVDAGRRLYSNCLTCHGPTGKGQPGVYPPLTRSEFVQGNPERLVKIVLHGLEGQVSVDGRTYAGVMPPPPLRSDEDVAAVLTYVRQAFGNDAGPVATELVARIRSEHAARRAPWTVKELMGE